MCNTKKILILGASDFQLPAILKAKEMKLHVAVADMNPDAVGVSHADKYYCVSTIDQKGVVDAAIDYQANAIITLCTDMPMRALAYACETLGLPGLDCLSAIRATDKGAMIEAFDVAGVAHPRFKVIKNIQELNLNDIDLEFPLITKPTDNSGSRGIMLVETLEELENAIKYSSKNGRNGEVIVEEYMHGPEVSVELMVIDGVPHVLQVTDKLTTLAPHFVEIGHSEPSRLSKHDREAVAELACEAALAVGIENGAGHAEIILTRKGPKMVEIGARMGGGCITTHLVPLSTGIDMTRAMINIALGEKADIDQKYEKGAAIRFIIPPIGKVIAIDGEDEAKRIDGVQVVEIQCKVGQVLSELESGASRIGYVIAQAETPEMAVSICEEALKHIHIQVE